MSDLSQRFPEPIEWKGQADMDCTAEDVWSRLSSDLSNYGWDVDPASSFFDGFAQGRNGGGMLDGRYWAFRIDHPERKPLVVMVQMDWDADSDGERYVDKSRVQRIEVRR